MSVPHALQLKPMLAQLAQDFLLPKTDNFSAGFDAQQMHDLWNPTLVGATEQLVKTNLGLVNITVGGKEDGPALLLWPSLMMKGTMWAYQYEHFRHSHRVVLIDSPGINKSEGLRKYIDLQDCARVVVDILDALGIQKCIFGGNSWGAMLAAVIPAWFPDRLIATLVINGTASVPTTPETILMTIRCEALMMNATVPEWWVNIARQAFSGDTAERSNPEFLAYCGVVSQEDPKSIAWAIRSILLGRKDMHSLLNTIQGVPVLVIAGAEDRQFPVPICKKMADAIPTSKFVVVEGVAHLAARENPDLINKEIDNFLKEVAGGN